MSSFTNGFPNEMLGLIDFLQKKENMAKCKKNSIRNSGKRHVPCLFVFELDPITDRFGAISFSDAFLLVRSFAPFFWTILFWIVCWKS
ncbi:MAG: hypothetical protein Q8P67_10155 [archaeon]|nr:hypothetical protein [archaeon]